MTDTTMVPAASAAERAVIGIAMCCGSEAAELVDTLGLDADHFGIATYRATWGAIRLLTLRGRAVNPEAVHAELCGAGVGGVHSLEGLQALAAAAAVVASMADGQPITRLAVSNARVLVAEALVRQLRTATRRAAEIAQRHNQAEEMAAALAETVLDALTRIHPLRTTLARLARFETVPARTTN